MDKNKKQVIDAEYTVTDTKIDKVTPAVEQMTTIVKDKEGNRLIWLALVMALFAFVSLLCSCLSRKGEV